MALRTFFDDDFREHAEDPAALKNGIEAERDAVALLREQFAAEASEENRARLGRHLQRLSEYLRLDGAYDEALGLKDEAIETWRVLGRNKAYFLSRLQRAIIVLDAGSVDEAVGTLEGLLEALDDETRIFYEDFVREAYARGLWHAGRRREACRQMERVLDMRAARGHSGHVEDTRARLERMRSGI